MKRRTKQFVTACLIVAAFTGTGAVSFFFSYYKSSLNQLVL